MSRHRLLSGINVHGQYRATFANSAARLADTGPYLATESIAGGSLNPAVALQLDTYAEFVLANHSPIVWQAITGAAGSLQQKDLLDNNSDYMVVGDKTLDKVVLVDYSFQLPISGRQRNGLLTLSHDGTVPTIDEDYYYEIGDEIVSVTFGATISGNDLRVTIVTASVGENPKLVYRKFALPIAA